MARSAGPSSGGSLPVGTIDRGIACRDAGRFLLDTFPSGRIVWRRQRAVAQRRLGVATASMPICFCHPSAHEWLRVARCPDWARPVVPGTRHGARMSVGCKVRAMLSWPRGFRPAQDSGAPRKHDGRMIPGKCRPSGGRRVYHAFTAHSVATPGQSPWGRERMAPGASRLIPQSRFGTRRPAMHGRP
jgi:hypothetical protein